MTYSVVSLFSGCGGLDLGFQGGFEYLKRFYSKLPFEIIWANEIDKAAAAIYKRNHDSHIQVGDIKDYLDKLPAAADVIIGGSPCQSFSSNNLQRLGLKGKSGAYVHYLKAVEILRPKAFVLENVAGLLEIHSRDLKQIVDSFASLGYTVSVNLLNAANYGVPQTRRRVFIVGTLGFQFFPPPPLLLNSPWVTTKQALDDLKYLPEDESISHVWSKYASRKQLAGRKLEANLPAATVTAGLHGKAPWHYEVDRRISCRELARLQSFPDRFCFKQTSRTAIERQIGNAVPPVLAWHVAKYLQQSLESNLSFTKWCYKDEH